MATPSVPQTVTAPRTDEDARPDLWDSDDPDRVAHYARKEDITRAAVEGGLVTALCGHKFPVTRDPAGMPVCQRCRQLHDALAAING